MASPSAAKNWQKKFVSCHEHKPPAIAGSTQTYFWRDRWVSRGDVARGGSRGFGALHEKSKPKNPTPYHSTRYSRKEIVGAADIVGAPVGRAEVVGFVDVVGLCVSFGQVWR